MRIAAHTAIAAAILAAAGLQAQQPPPDRFRFERAIATDGSGPRRLAIDVALLAGAEPGFRDLRLFDQGGAPVPYLLLQPPSQQPQWNSGTLLPLATTEKTSGFEVDFRGANTIDAVRVEGCRRRSSSASRSRAAATASAGRCCRARARCSICRRRVCARRS